MQDAASHPLSGEADVSRTGQQARDGVRGVAQSQRAAGCQQQGEPVQLNKGLYTGGKQGEVQGQSALMSVEA